MLKLRRKKKKEFEEKRKKMYGNEFKMAKEQSNKVNDDEELLEETMRNTLYNKYVGKLGNENHIDIDEDKETHK